MFVGWCGGEARVDRNGAQHELHRGQLRAVGQLVAVARIESADKGEGAGSKEQEASASADPDRPPGDKRAPKEGGQREVGPEQKFGVVPGPRSDREEKTKQQGGDGHAAEDARRGIRAARTKDGHGAGGNERQKDAEIPKPEPKSAFTLHPPRLEAQRTRCGETGGDQMDEPRCGNDADESRGEKRAEAAAAPGGRRAGGKKNAEKEKGRRVEEGHRGIEGDLGRHGQ